MELNFEKKKEISCTIHVHVRLMKVYLQFPVTRLRSGQIADQISLSSNISLLHISQKKKRLFYSDPSHAN